MGFWALVWLVYVTALTPARWSLRTFNRLDVRGDHLAGVKAVKVYKYLQSYLEIIYLWNSSIDSVPHWKFWLVPLCMADAPVRFLSKLVSCVVNTVFVCSWCFHVVLHTPGSVAFNHRHEYGMVIDCKRSQTIMAFKRSRHAPCTGLFSWSMICTMMRIHHD